MLEHPELLQDNQQQRLQLYSLKGLSDYMENCNNVQRLGETRNETYWIVYETINTVNNKIYVGVHGTADPNVFDGYIGNGIYITQPCSYRYGKTAMECAVKKYGPNAFKRTVLQVFTNEEDAYRLEEQIVNQNFLARSDVYNMVLGGRCPSHHHPTKVVYQYDLCGNFQSEYASLQQAAQAVHRNPATLSDAAINNISCANFYWAFVKCSKLDLTKYHNLRKQTKLYQYSLDGKYLQEFPSAASTGYTQAQMSAILGNIVDKKYYFCYVKAASYSVARDIYVKSRKIYQYSASGQFLKEWNYLDALKVYKNDGINQAIRHKTLTKSGFFWGLQKYPIYNQPIIKAQREVAKYDLNGNLVKIYKNTACCYKENGRGVYKCLVGLRKQHKNFYYQYVS